MSMWWKWLLSAIIVAGTPCMLRAEGYQYVQLFGIDQSTEIRIGQQAAAELENRYGVVYDSRQTARVQRIGLSIAAVSKRRSLPWRFRILNMSDVNALSLPGGFIYVTRGLLATRLDDNELAGVLAHEVAHVNERHAVKAIERAMTIQLLASLIFGRSSAAIQTAAGLAIRYAIELPNSRSNEYQADAVGIRLAYNAGYSPFGLVDFLRLLQRLSGRQRSPEWLQTHPLTSERITRAQQIAEDVSHRRRPVSLALSTDEQKTLKKLIDEENATAHKTTVLP